MTWIKEADISGVDDTAKAISINASAMLGDCGAVLPVYRPCSHPSSKPFRTAQTTSSCFVSIPSLSWML